MSDGTVPTTRWAAAGGGGAMPYLQRFDNLIASGEDIDGEARLADALAPRNARILDAGAGMGRVAAALQARGHDVLAAEPDPVLVAESRKRWPDLPVVGKDILELDPDSEGTFDLIVVVGNVMVLLAEGTEVRALSTLRGLLKPVGRILVGFHLHGGPADKREEYVWEEFSADVTAADLVP
ncbi:MAG TPA: class I SAM-dependent methyltransferase, partial [Marmoricola sp.]